MRFLVQPTVPSLEVLFSLDPVVGHLVVVRSFFMRRLGNFLEGESRKPHSSSSTNHRLFIVNDDIFWLRRTLFHDLLVLSSRFLGFTTSLPAHNSSCVAASRSIASPSPSPPPPPSHAHPSVANVPASSVLLNLFLVRFWFLSLPRPSHGIFQGSNPILFPSDLYCALIVFPSDSLRRPPSLECPAVDIPPSI